MRAKAPEAEEAASCLIDIALYAVIEETPARGYSGKRMRPRAQEGEEQQLCLIDIALYAVSEKRQHPVPIQDQHQQQQAVEARDCRPYFVVGGL